MPDDAIQLTAHYNSQWKSVIFGAFQTLSTLVRACCLASEIGTDISDETLLSTSNHLNTGGESSNLLVSIFESLFNEAVLLVRQAT